VQLLLPVYLHLDVKEKHLICEITSLKYSTDINILLDMKVELGCISHCNACYTIISQPSPPPKEPGTLASPSLHTSQSRSPHCLTSGSNGISADDFLQIGNHESGHGAPSHGEQENRQKNRTAKWEAKR